MTSKFFISRPSLMFPAAVLCMPLWGQQSSKGQRVRLDTTDGWKLSAQFYPASKPNPKKTAVVFLHGLGAGKNEWSAFQETLAGKGVASLAVDLRGHGGSLKKNRKKATYQEFIDRGPGGEWANMWKDAEAGYKFAAAKGYRRIGLSGASVGANVVAIAAAKLPNVHFLILLSPGADYQGIRPAEALDAYGPRRLLLATSEADGYGYQSAAFLRNIRFSARLPVDWAQTKAGHGVQMFQDRQLTDRIARWIVEDGD